MASEERKEFDQLKDWHDWYKGAWETLCAAIEKEAPENESIRAERDRYKAALEVLANRENWCLVGISGKYTGHSFIFVGTGNYAHEEAQLALAQPQIKDGQ